MSSTPAKKRRLIQNQFLRFAVALAIVAAVLFSLAHLHSRGLRRSQYWGIGAALIRTTNSPNLVAVNPALRSRLELFLAPVDPLAIRADVEKASHGDVSAPIGDGTASGHVILINQKHERLGLRLKYDDVQHNYRVLDFWTPEPN
jgi:hypothetical protein